MIVDTIMPSISPRYPDLEQYQTVFDIAFGIGKHLDSFAKSFSEPFCYYYMEWPDWLLMEGTTYIMIQRFPQNGAMTGMANFLDHVTHVEGGNIRFNLQDLMPLNVYTMAELKHIVSNSALRGITHFYEDDHHELTTEELKLRVASLDIDINWMEG